MCGNARRSSSIEIGDAYFLCGKHMYLTTAMEAFPPDPAQPLAAGGRRVSLDPAAVEAKRQPPRRRLPPPPPPLSVFRFDGFGFLRRFHRGT